MIKLESRQRPMTKIGTKEKELKYVLNLVLSGNISEKEVIEFACNDGTKTLVMMAAVPATI